MSIREVPQAIGFPLPFAMEPGEEGFAYREHRGTEFHGVSVELRVSVLSVCEAFLQTFR
jgi:hypothetical protein